MGALYRAQGRYGEAEPLYKKALQLNEKSLGADHPNTLGMRLNYAVCLINLKKEKQALAMLKKMEKSLLARAGMLLATTQKQRVRNQFLTSKSNFQDALFTLARDSKIPEIQIFAADVMLRWKQIQSEEEAYMANLSRTSGDPKIKNLSKKIMKLRSELSRLFDPANPKNTDPILAELEAAESKLAQISRDFKSQLHVAGASAEDLHFSLPQNSALIELRMYRVADHKTGKLGELHWAAALILADESDKWLYFEDLGPVKDTVELRDKMQAADGKKRREYSTKLWQKLFGKFELHIKNVKTLYIAPDHFLSLLSFARLTLPNGKYWIENQDVRRVQTGRDLLRDSEKFNNGTLLALGGVNFDTYPKGVKAPKKTNNLQMDYIFRAAGELGAFGPLPQSKIEVETIGGYYKVCQSEPQILTGNQASEAALKNLTAPPRVLHLSTHGFYLGTDEDVERPMLLSGLALAGANQGFKGKIGADGEDGILYSMEVLGLNLKGTELVSLSACKTGQGIVNYSEGVYGLVRAFRVAGADSVLMTLWSVDDSESEKFITHFYKTWLQQKIRPAEALKQTQLYFISQKRDPNMWSPYVVVGK
ncbi:hypothetical protein GMMP13_1170001 [Candidatus Magnetomoraceae bacterium gMMP-13]